MNKLGTNKTNRLFSWENLALKTKRSLILGVSTLFLLTSCGGGDSATQIESEPVASSNWDSMRWDQDNWQ